MPNERMPTGESDRKWDDDSAIDSWENPTDDPMAADSKGERGDRQIDEETLGFDDESRDFTLPEEESTGSSEGDKSWIDNDSNEAIDDEIDYMEQRDDEDEDIGSRERAGVM